MALCLLGSHALCPLQRSLNRLNSNCPAWGSSHRSDSHRPQHLTCECQFYKLPEHTVRSHRGTIFLWALWGSLHPTAASRPKGLVEQWCGLAFFISGGLQRQSVLLSFKSHIPADIPSSQTPAFLEAGLREAAISNRLPL